MHSSSEHPLRAKFRSVWIPVLFFLLGWAVPTSAQQGVQTTEAYETLNQRVIALYKKGRYEQAMPLAVKTLKEAEDTFGAVHPRVVQALNNLAELKRKQGHYADAEHLYLRSVNIGVKSLGRNHPTVAILLSNLALLYETRGNFDRAEIYYRHALKICKSTVGSKHPKTTRLIGLLAALQKKQEPNASPQTKKIQPIKLKETSSRSKQVKKNIEHNASPVLSKLP